MFIELSLVLGFILCARILDGLVTSQQALCLIRLEEHIEVSVFGWTTRSGSLKDRSADLFLLLSLPTEMKKVRKRKPPQRDHAKGCYPRSTEES